MHMTSRAKNLIPRATGAFEHVSAKAAMREPTVSVSYVGALADFIASKGVDVRALLYRVGLTLDDLKEADSRLPFAKLKTLMREAKIACNDPALALHFGEDPLLYQRSIVGLIIRSAETMGEAFAQFSRFARLVVEIDSAESGDRFAVERASDGVWLIDRRPNPNDFPELTEATYARLVSDYRRHFPDLPTFVKAAHMTHSDPGYRSEYDRLLQAPLRFESERNALLVDPAWLTTKMPPANRYAHNIFSARAETLLRQLEGSTTARGAVEGLLVPILHTGSVSLDQIAAKLGVSRRTLQRNLKLESTSFAEVLDDVRRTLALGYLEEKGISVNETAYLVGFSEPAGFSRAFKRWTGRSPRATRQAARMPKIDQRRGRADRE